MRKNLFLLLQSQIGYSQSASLLAHNLIKEVPTHRFRLGGLEAGDFLNEIKKIEFVLIKMNNSEKNISLGGRFIMKYIVVLGDGMADEPLAELDEMTPLEYADTPTMDRLAAKSEMGMVQTIPEGMAPGSDIANLAVLGYNPKEYYTGRSSLEALSIGVDMKDTDIAVRTNFVTLSREKGIPYKERTILDHSAGEISTEEAAFFLDMIKKEFQDDNYQFYLGTSYRHLLIWNKGEAVELTAPHDILGQKIGNYLPKDKKLSEMMEKSFLLLDDHPNNDKRERYCSNRANSIWFWGAGTKPALSSFQEKTGLKGAMISAVDLLKGIAIGAGMKVMEVEDATGDLHTNYRGKAQAAIDALLKENFDFAYVHLEAPDEMGHQGRIEHKVMSIEYLDRRIIRPIVEAMEEAGEEFRILIMPDHPTPIRCRTHTSDPVPYLLYDSTKEVKNSRLYCEKEAKETGILVREGYRITEKLFGTYTE